MNRASQRALIDRNALAREFSRADLSPYFRPNGTRLPAGADYAAHVAAGFADWRVKVSGLVARPLSLSLADIRAMPQRTQITRHDCVEGRSEEHTSELQSLMRISSAVFCLKKKKKQTPSKYKQ